MTYRCPSDVLISLKPDGYESLWNEKLQIGMGEGKNAVTHCYRESSLADLSGGRCILNKPSNYSFLAPFHLGNPIILSTYGRPIIVPLEICS